MSNLQPKNERLDELLAQQAVFELSAEEQIELRKLLDELDVDRETYERTAALAAVAMQPGQFEPMPEELKARIAAAAAEHMGTRNAPASTAAYRGFTARDVAEEGISGTSRVLRLREIVAWMVAAACLLIAFTSWRTFSWSTTSSSTAATEAGKLAEARAALGKLPESITIPWTATDDPAGKQASGDVVWNSAKQQGYMRFKGLAANDVKQSQYQLWIFDGKQDERYPIDGGVFDVTKNGDVIVPIQAKLYVADPKMFAVTVEKPGGVVVSDRKHIAVIAKPAT